MTGVVDTHTHVACGDDARFPFRPTGTASDWWRSGGSIDDLLVDLDDNGVERVVIVQAVGAYGYDCDCAAHATAAHPERASLVVAVDMAGEDPAAALAALLDVPPSGARISGVRAFGVGGATTDWLTDGRGAALWEVAGAHGVVVVPTVFADRFDELARIVAQHPTVPVAVDHCGFLDMAGGDGERQLFALAEFPSVHLKVSSYVLEAGARDDGDPAVVVERLVAAFGADHLCWGSDHPQDQRHDYASKLALARRAARNLDSAQREALLSETGARLFF